MKGQGPGGAVVSADVEAAQAPDAALSTTWRLMAERTTQTWTTTPHFFLQREVDATRLVAWRTACQKLSGPGVTYTDLLVRVAAAALRRHADINARWEGNRIVRSPAINVGVAVATEQGLVVPVIHNAGGLPLLEISRRRAELVAKAREGRLRLEDISGGTFTISNLGMHAVDAFIAILNAPQAAILAVGRIADRVMAIAGQPAVRAAITLSLSCDHRAVEGTRGARFLETVAAMLEEPASLVE